jgi:hypothetical protein
MTGISPEVSFMMISLIFILTAIPNRNSRIAKTISY